MLCHAKEAAAGCGLQNMEGFLEEGAGGFYRELENLARFYRNCVCAARLLSHFQGGTKLLKWKTKKGRGEDCRREEKVILKSSFAEAPAQPF